MLIKDLLIKHHPKINNMPFMSEVEKGKFGREEILLSEIVELYRALNTREKIQNIYKKKLKDGLNLNIITKEESDIMTEVIDDEGETEEHIDHLDMRFKLFEGNPVKRGVVIKRNEDLEKINNEWVSICNESDLFTLMSCTCAIEGWYPSISKFFEKEYLKRGFKNDELEIFTAHQDADVEHSNAQYGILEKNSANINTDEIERMVKRTFSTSRAYEKMKLEFATSNKSLNFYIE